MKKGFFGGVALAALVAAGTPAALADPPQKFTFSFNFVLFDSCSGEFVQFNGSETFSVQFSTNKNNFHEVFQITIHADGIGQSTGADYRENVEENIENDGSFSGFPVEENLVVNEHFIGQGAVANESMRETFHITINADGTVTVVRISSELTCQG
jgi:hypothetical protein